MYRLGRFLVNVDDVSYIETEEYSTGVYKPKVVRKTEKEKMGVFAKTKDVVKRYCADCGDELDEDRTYIIKNELQDYLYELFKEAKDIKQIIEIDAKKYNF